MAARATPRRRILHTCGISISKILHKAYAKAKDFNGPVGSVTKRAATIITSASAFSFIYTLQHQCIAVLSFADDRILAIENLVETLFPPSTRLFNKIDELVNAAESLPGKFDNAMNNFPIIINQVPFLDWALAYLISWLNFLISELTHWGSSNTREKEIMIDINYDNLNNQSLSLENSNFPAESTTIAQFETVESSPPPKSDSLQDQTEAVGEEKCPIPVESPTHTQSENMEKSFPPLDFLQDETQKVGEEEKSFPPLDFLPDETQKVGEEEEKSFPPLDSLPDETQKVGEEEEKSFPPLDSLPDETQKVGEEEEKSFPPLDSLPDETRKVGGEEEIPVESPTNTESKNEEKSSPLSDHIPDETQKVEEGHCPEESTTNAQCENVKLSPKSDVVKCSYKEVLEKGSKESIGEKEERIVEEDNPTSTASAEEVGKGTEKDDADKGNEPPEDPILDLFEASWHKSSGRW